jgi:ABC-type antimicrobial peptide transport system permease subunit
MEATPGLITALTGFLGAATLLHFGVVSARRHSRHLAVLRALGMRRRDCVRVLAWHALLVAGTALVVGVPLGIAAGRVAWLAIADGLHVVPVATLPPPATALIAVVVIGAALVAASVPGRFTTRHAPAMALRAE